MTLPLGGAVALRGEVARGKGTCEKSRTEGICVCVGAERKQQHFQTSSRMSKETGSEEKVRGG